MTETKGEYSIKSTKLKICDAGDPRRYYTQVPNMVDDSDLSVFAFRLYIHLKRVAGDEGSCWQSTETLAESCKMGMATVSRSKTELSEKGFIFIEEIKDEHHPGRAFHRITIKDLWPENSSRYQTSPQKLQTSCVEVQTSPQELKNNPIKNNINNDEEKASSSLLEKKSESKQTSTKKKKDNKEIDYSAFSEGEKYFLQAFRSKRFSNEIQYQAVKKLEEKMGFEKLKEMVDWCAKMGMDRGKAITSMESMSDKWGQKKPQQNKTGPALPRQRYRLPDGTEIWVDERERKYLTRDGDELYTGPYQ